MSRIEWDRYSEKKFSYGVDRGVLYVGDTAVPWNGLISISEKSSGGEVSPVYYDGYVIRNLAQVSHYQATLSAFFSPEEFDQCEGVIESPYSGFYATNQPRIPFGLSYRTSVSDDAGQVNHRIHLIYDAIVEPPTKDYTTLSSSPEATALTWDIKASSSFILGKQISAHYIFDGTKVEPFITEVFEDHVYGSDKTKPKLPTASDIYNIFEGYWGLDVSLSADQTYYTISGSDVAVYQDGDSYVIRDYSVTDQHDYYVIE